jgi:hypothetical protein
LIPFSAPIRTWPETASVGNSLSPLIIAGCIGYDDSLDRKRHLTSFGFRSTPKPAIAQSGTAVSKMEEVWTPYSVGYGIAY